MPITFAVANKVKPEEVFNERGYSKRQSLKTEDVVAEVWQSKKNSCQEVLNTSLTPTPEFISNESGFLHTVIRAYNGHHNLIIRPDDLWTAILAQFSIYVNAHAEELRSKFVAHDDKRTLKVETGGNRYTVDFGKIAQVFGDLLKENIVDPSLHDWIIPDFSTSTHNDKVICSIMMMSTLKAYFQYEVYLRCGVPKVTLLGEKSDYESILQRLPRLEEFGQEPAAFARLLGPILQQCVLSFEAVESGDTPDIAFWGKMCHYHPTGSGPTYVLGWISTFAVWDKKGVWQGPDLSQIDKPWEQEEMSPSPAPIIIDGLRYPVIDTNKIPRGFCEVGVFLDDNGEEFNCEMIAGHVGAVASASGEEILDTLQPASEWFMFIKGEAKTKAKR